MYRKGIFHSMGTFLIIFTSLISVATATFVGDETPSYHSRFNGRELAEIFGVNHHDNVPKHVSTKVHGLQKPEADIQHSLSMKAFDHDFNIKVTMNKNFVADTHTTEFINGDGNSTKYNGVLGVYSFGVVENDPNSHVAFHHTGKGISGSIRTSNDLYIINPLPYRLKTEKADHIVFRASDVPGDHIITKPLREDEIVSDRKTHSRTRRSTSLPKKTVELLIAADYKMLQFYGEDLLPSYMLAVANVMSGFFRDATLSYPLDVVVVRSTIFKTDILQGKTMSHLLSQFSNWCNENNNLDENSEEHFDAALLFTRNGCADGCGLEGLAYAGVTCNIQKSQGVARDRGFMTSVTLAHEFGHIINAGHDGTGGCPDGLNIMASGGIRGGPPAMKWSQCSSTSIEATLKSSVSSCFDDKPPQKKTDSTFQLYGTIYNADKQCQYMLGHGAQKCSSYQYRCDALFCNTKGTLTCTTLFFPAIHGTYCEKYKWCIEGTCVPDGTRAPPIHGGWSSWGEYTSCNKPCDIGVQWRVRNCNNPTPEHGGDWCDKTGYHKESQRGHYRTCNRQKCVGTTMIKDKYYPDRNEQCNAVKPGSSFCSYCPGIGSCSLYCGKETYGTLEGYTKSGTYCKTSVFENGVCVHGACVEIGCDLNLNSGKIDDRCGTCNGDGSPCTPFSGTDTTRHKSLGRRGNFFVTTIPINATKVVVQEYEKTVNFLTCKIGNSDSLAIPLATYGKVVQLDGAVIRYKLTGFPNQDAIYIDGVLKVPVHIIYSNLYYYGASKGIRWSYTVLGATPSGQVEVIWFPDNWSACSRSCAGGWKTRSVHCRRKDDNTPASIDLCKALTDIKPPIKAECKPENCPPVWYISDWSVCTRSCGTGERTRTITCAELTKGGSYNPLDESKCLKQKPTSPISEKCNDISCSAHWEILTPYSACSKSCGGGVATREVGCRRLDRGTKLIVVTELECVGINKTVKPESTKACNKDVSCPGWLVEYSDCSATCGAGVRQPNIVCSAGGSEKKLLPFEKCDQSKKPLTKSLTLKDCNSGVCAGYKWGIKEGVCSTTCGEGVITSTIYCYDLVTKRNMDDIKCPALLKPTIPTPKECNPGICADVYVWKNDRYGSICSKTCGGGVLLSIPYCVQLKTGLVVSKLSCDAASKPKLLTKSCNTNTCPPYDWSIRYNDCSLTCGKGVQVGTAVCKKIIGGLIVDYSLCNKLTKPTDKTKDCQLEVCPDPALFNWKLNRIGCNVTCGRGAIVKELVCYRKDSEMKFTKVSPRHCAGKPEPVLTTEECVLTPCPPTHQWNKVNQYCAIGCGKGFNVIELNCTVIKTKEIADGKSCAGLNTPVSDCKRSCTEVKVKANPKIYPIGCFADSLWDRKVSQYFKNFRNSFNRSNPFPTIINCYQGAIEKKLFFFALQFFGECWVGDNNTLNTYDAAGRSNQCTAGTGRHSANYVYHIGSPLPTINIYVVKYGCMVAPNNSTTNSGTSPLLLARIIPICGPISYKKKYDYFGGDSDGNCLTNADTEKTIKSPSFSSACLPDIKDKSVMQYHIFAFVKN